MPPSNQPSQARITLVGAGPGDPELLTIKGKKAIRSADVILYDSLVNPALLTLNPHAEKLYVGKRKGQHSLSQRDINALIVDLALTNRHVVRLKGGDPMVFGRAMEEIEAARQHGIPITVVPGVSSYSGMAAYHQLPLTQRGVSQSFWIVTGTTEAGTISHDMALAAQSSATVIVFMGLGQLAGIVDLFSRHQPADYPISIIQNATRPDVRTLTGQLDNIVALQAIAQLGSPALVVLGQAARHLQDVEAHLATHQLQEA